MFNVDRRKFKVIKLKLIYEPLQRHCVPYYLAFRVNMCFLNGFLHIVIRDGIVAPSIIYHHMVTEGPPMNDNPVMCQVFNGFYYVFFSLLVNYTMCKQLDDGLAVLSEVIMEVSCHSAHKVCVSCLQVSESF